MATKKKAPKKKTDPNKVTLLLKVDNAVAWENLATVIDDIELGCYGIEEVATVLTKIKTTSEIEAEIGVQDLIDAIEDSNKAEEVFKAAFDGWVSEEDIEEKAEELGVRKPMKAIDYPAEDFRRKLCDVFEVGYHTDALTLTQMVAEKLNADILVV